MSVERIIGIDFGTSTSLVKVKAYRDGQPVDGDPTSTQAVEFDNGRVTTPTLIRFAGDTEYYGQDAVSPKLDSTLCKNFKLDLQSPDPAAKAQAQELTRKFFRFLYEQYSGQSTRFGQFDAERTLVSYPAKWKPETREFMLQAARDAGFQHVSGMDEPTAALYTVMVQESARLVRQGYLTAGKPAYVLMIDMGAGTTDLALCRYTPGGQNRIIDTWPPAESKVLFGGREMDELLIRYLADYLKRCNLPEKMVTTLEKNNLEDCKAWKENTVSSALARGATADECAFVTSMLMWAGENTAPFPAIDRAVLEDYCKDYIGRYAELIAGAMAHARQAAPEFDAGDLALAVLTGGHSQWYFAKDMLCCVLPGYEGGVGVRLSANQVVTLKPPQHTVSSGLVFSVQDVAPAEQPQAEPQPTPQQEQRRQQTHSRPTPPTPQPELKQQQQTYTYTTSSSTAPQTTPPKNSGFDILLKSTGANGIAVIKAVRDITGLELGDAKRIVDSAPGVVKSGVSKEEAETIKNRLAGLGATVEITEKPSVSDCTSSDKEATTGPILRYPEQVKQLRALTALDEPECEMLLINYCGDLRKSLQSVYEPLLDVSNEDFTTLAQDRIAEWKYTDGYAVQTLMKCVPIPRTEEVCFYQDNDNNRIFVTTSQIVEIEKKGWFGTWNLESKVVFENVMALSLKIVWEEAVDEVFCYIQFWGKTGGITQFLLPSDSDESTKHCGNRTKTALQIYIAAYLRWRAQNGLDPYDIKPIIEE